MQQKLPQLQLNQVIYIQNIGYGTVIDGYGSRQRQQIKDEVQKKQLLYFDPELFSSENKQQNNKICQTIVVANSYANFMKCKNKGENGKEGRKVDCGKNGEYGLEGGKIVKVRLEGTQIMVHCPYQTVRKYVNIQVCPVFISSIGIITITIQISKTIQSLKRQIFDFLGLNSSHYYNIKFYITNPILTQLSHSSKTIWQAGIKQQYIVIMMAQHGFCFQNIPNHLLMDYCIINNNLSFVSLPKKNKIYNHTTLTISSPQKNNNCSHNAAQNINHNLDNLTGNCMYQSPVPSKKQGGQNQIHQQGKKDGTIIKQEIIKENGLQKQQQQVNSIESVPQNINPPQKAKTTEKQKSEAKYNGDKQQQKIEKEQIERLIPDTLQIKADKFTRSGRHYFEVKLDKLPINIQHLKIGITSLSGDKKWYYNPLNQQKIYIQNNQIKYTSKYGIIFKQGDIVGVLIKIDRNGKMKVNYYRNNINLGICFQDKISQIGFIFCLGSEGQISLDSRVQPPIDSYRFR